MYYMPGRGKGEREMFQTAADYGTALFVGCGRHLPLGGDRKETHNKPTEAPLASHMRGGPPPAAAKEAVLCGGLNLDEIFLPLLHNSPPILPQ